MLAFAAQECRGVAQTFYGTPIFTLTSLEVPTICFLATGEQLEIESSPLTESFDDPPVPPPRIDCA